LLPKKNKVILSIKIEINQ